MRTSLSTSTANRATRRGKVSVYCAGLMLDVYAAEEAFVSRTFDGLRQGRGRGPDHRRSRPGPEPRSLPVLHRQLIEHEWPTKRGARRRGAARPREDREACFGLWCKVYD